MGTNGLTDRLYTKDESLIRYSGLLTQKVRNATNLKQLLMSHFSIPVEIEQFVGQWEELIEDVRTRLPDQNTLQAVMPALVVPLCWVKRAGLRRVKYA